tara:strand:+ start:344 stop:499 length:156 start_codon:yes stop_codon:yes gene_type:complete
MEKLEKLLERCEKELERLEEVEVDITAHGGLEAQILTLEEVIEWIKEEIDN